MMTPEETEKYKSRCREIESMFCRDYSNPELEKMMLQPYWKEFYKQHLTASERKKIQSYLQLMKDPSVGCLDSQISLPGISNFYPVS